MATGRVAGSPRPRRVVRLTLAAAAGVVLLLGLSYWQVQRAQWKDGLIAERAARLAAPPTPLPAVVADPALLAFTRAWAEGTFDHAREITVLRPALDGASGYHVVTPLARPDGGWVLVDRGWVPLDRRDPATRPEGQLAGPVRVTGIVIPGDRAGAFTPDNDPAGGAWFVRDPAAIAAAAGIAALPVILEADAAPNPGGLPLGGQTATALTSDHRGYAATWFALAVALAVIYAMLLRRELRWDTP